MEVIAKKLTYQEFKQLEFDDDDPYWYELINGEIVQKQAPTIDHQNTVENILMAMKTYARERGLGRVHTAPLDVVLDNENAYHPDVLFIKKDRFHIIDKREGIVIGTPDLVVEVLSKSTAAKDKGIKRDIYEKSGVREYWLVEPNSKVVEIYAFVDQRFKLVQYAQETGEVESKVLEGFKLDLAKIFEE